MDKNWLSQGSDEVRVRNMRRPDISFQEVQECGQHWSFPQPAKNKLPPRGPGSS